MANNPAPAPKGAMAPGGMTDIYGNPVVQNPIAPGGYTSEYGAPNQFAAGYDKAGYTWDPVKGAYVTKASSAPSQNALFGQLTGGLSGALGGSTGSGAMGGLTSLLPGGGTGSGGGVAPLAMQDTSAADAANLTRTKDTVGKESAGAMRGLREALGARGMLGSGLESRGTEQSKVRSPVSSKSIIPIVLRRQPKRTIKAPSRSAVKTSRRLKQQRNATKLCFSAS
jgi:hypothetical protein